MTSHLRSEAHASGWPKHIVNNMHVSYGKEGFQANVHESHEAEAKNLEYGTPSSQPTAAVRRFSNRTQEAETFLVGRLSKMIGHL